VNLPGEGSVMLRNRRKQCIAKYLFRESRTISLTALFSFRLNSFRPLFISSGMRMVIVWFMLTPFVLQCKTHRLAFQSILIRPASLGRQAEVYKVNNVPYSYSGIP
jgi:hypothetical protein